jgi:AraC family transcriptional regulator
VFAIELDAGWNERMATLPGMFDEPRLIESGTVAAVAMRLFDESRRKDLPSALVVEGLMLELLGSLSRSSAGLAAGPAPIWMRMTEEILHARFRDPPSVSEIALTVGVHPVHLARAFRGRHGCSVSDYVCQLRIEAGCAAMSSKLSLSQIAIELGFCDQSHFTKAFHRLVGMTPARFRAAVAPPSNAASGRTESAGRVPRPSDGE